MQHGHERESKPVGDNFYLAEGEIALVQLSIRDPLFDELVHELFDFLRRRFL